jgi:glucoamylase
MARSARARRRFLGSLAGLAAVGVLLPLGGASASAATEQRAVPAAGGVAPGGPGTMSYFDLARKDCVGTSAATASKVWYTVAGGVLSDTYEPTIDNTNVAAL